MSIHTYRLQGQDHGQTLQLFLWKTKKEDAENPVKSRRELLNIIVMKNVFYGCLVWFLIGPVSGFSQQTIPKYSFFESSIRSAKQDYSSEVEDGVLLEFSPEKAKAFSREAPQTFEMGLVIGTNGEQLNLILEKSNIFAEGFKITTFSNPDKALDFDPGLHYHGTVEGENNSVVAISVHDDYISGVVRTSKGNYNLGKLKNAQNEHVVYLDRLLKHSYDFKCATEADGHTYSREMLEDNADNRNVGDCIRVYIEVGYSVTEDLGSAGAASAFAIDLFNQSFSLFATESINMTISSMYVWNAPDPYTGPSLIQYLTQFQNATDVLVGDIGHLLVFDGEDGEGGGGGGVADTINGLCGPTVNNRLCLTVLEKTSVEELPTYSRNVKVVTHEMGHLLGSNHTHACVWNGNNTQIDDCGNQWVLHDLLDNDIDFFIDEQDEWVTAEGADCFDVNAPILPSNGTIMSYCDQFTDLGVDMVFDSQVATVMRNTVANAVCLNSDCGSCELTLDCSNLTPQFIECPEDIPEANPDLVTVESACAWPIDVEVTETGSGYPGDPIIRTYTVNDAVGMEATCVQYFFGSGSTVAVTSAWPTECVLSKFTINGNYFICPSLDIVELELQFWQNGVPSGVGVIPTINSSTNTWTFSSTLTAMEQAGLAIGNEYDIYPFLTLSDGSVILGDELEMGFNNDIRFAAKSDPQVVLNEEEDDLNTSQLTFCAGDTIFYHGIDSLSNNHFVSITRRPVGSPGGYTEYRKFGGPSASGWVGESLDGFTASLQEIFPPDPNFDPPEYFVAGYEYRLQVASSNNPECITWSPIYIEFRVVDCCAPEWELADVPECVVDGEVSALTVILDGPIDSTDIGYIYSSNNDYTVVGHEIIDHENTLELIIYFVSNHCTCEGNSFIFDIDLSCNSTVWIMTDHIPCCDTDCGFLEIVDWSADEECIVVNGNPGHEFCIEVSSDMSILNVLPGSNNATCQVELSNLEITQPGIDGMYSICGYMAFTDPQCVGFAIVTLVLETESGCCTIQQGFSFPNGCELEEPCLGGAPEIQVIYAGYMTVSLNIPTGQTVVITDLIAGGIELAQVHTILCGPFSVSQGGVVSGGTECNGIEISTPLYLNCHEVEGEVPYIPYHFELVWGGCIWILSGNYCDELIAVQSFQDGGTEQRVEENSAKVDTPSGQLLVFPNPLGASNILNFDVSKLNQSVQSIQIKDLQGRKIESFVPGNNQQVFSHQLSRSLSPGVYLIMIKLEDGSVSSTKLIMTE